VELGRTSAVKIFACRRLPFNSLEECENQSLFYQGKLDNDALLRFFNLSSPRLQLSRFIILSTDGRRVMIALNRLAIGGSCESI
jgi:hypothetical protein